VTPERREALKAILWKRVPDPTYDYDRYMRQVRELADRGDQDAEEYLNAVRHVSSVPVLLCPD
jgi:hypothetical protein